MKRFVTLFVLLMVTFVTACSDDDSTTSVSPCTELSFPGPHHGIWNLVNVSGSIAGVSNDFEPGLIKWNFNACNETVTVVNNNEDETVEDFFSSGTYQYTLLTEPVPPACDQYLIIENIELGCMIVSGNEMTLTQQVADGYELKFTR